MMEDWYAAPNPMAMGDGAWGYEAFNYDAMGNMQEHNHLGRWGWTWFNRRDSGLNQYLDWGIAINCDGKGVATQDGSISVRKLANIGRSTWRSRRNQASWSKSTSK